MSQIFRRQYGTQKGEFLMDGIDCCHAVYAGAPTASASGYTKGCIWVDTTNAVAYINIGSRTSATWKLLAYDSETIAALTITAGTVTTLTNTTLTGATATFSATLGVTGATTLTGGVAGGKPWNINTWQAVAATSGTDTACTNGTAYVGSIYVPMNCTVTGIQYLIGSVGGTDKVIASLHDSTGALLANSSQSGLTVGTSANLQQVALTATYAAVGPAYYFIALTFNGTTAKFRTVPAHTQNGLLSGSVTQTFGTSASFTAPTTFTADKAPVASLY